MLFYFKTPFIFSYFSVRGWLLHWYPFLRMVGLLEEIKRRDARFSVDFVLITYFDALVGWQAIEF